MPCCNGRTRCGPRIPPVQSKPPVRVLLHLLQWHILRLKEAQYSPSPVRRNDELIWDELELIAWKQVEFFTEPSGLALLNH